MSQHATATSTTAASVPIYFDGGCDLDSRIMHLRVDGPGWHAEDSNLATVVHGVGVTSLPAGTQANGTGNQAQWLAAVLGLEEALRLGQRNVVMTGDAKLIIDQADGPPSKCEDPVLRAIRDRYVALKPLFGTVHWRYVPTGQNISHLNRP